jgi:catechol 2,3-dioxygenase-like lactoylglutathione lyase family enzyme
MKIRFRHVCLTVKDLERSIAFYCGHLGFTRGPEFRNEKGECCGIFLYLNSGDFLELFRGENNHFSGHICLEVDDIQEATRALREKGFALADPSMGRSGAWITGLRDPDGYTVELNEFSPPQSWIRKFLEQHDPGQTLAAGEPATRPHPPSEPA